MYRGASYGGAHTDRRVIVMKKLTRHDWVLVLFATITLAYSLTVLIAIFSHPLFSKGAGWLGSPISLLVWLILLLTLTVLVLARVATLSQEIYRDLPPHEQEFVGKVVVSTAREVYRSVRRRKDRIGKAARTAERIVKRA